MSNRAAVPLHPAARSVLPFGSVTFYIPRTRNWDPDGLVKCHVDPSAAVPVRRHPHLSNSAHPQCIPTGKRYSHLIFQRVAVPVRWPVTFYIPRTRGPGVAVSRCHGRTVYATRIGSLGTRSVIHLPGEPPIIYRASEHDVRTMRSGQS